MRPGVLALALVLAACAATTAPLRVPSGTRAVVVAPHPDDETLAAGGLIQRILRTGGTVRVIVMTSGDGFLEAAARLTGDHEPSSDDYRTLGAARATEVREAARILGVRDLRLLDRPDGGLDALWASDAPYVSPATGRGPFSGAVLRGELRVSLEAVDPTLVVAPDPRDQHPDHAAAARFTLAAVDELATRPMVLTYLVHDTVWPPPHPPYDELPPPSGDGYAETPWTSFVLEPDELATKRAALAAHRSQWPIIGGLLERFLRRNEVFAVRGDRPKTASWVGEDARMSRLVARATGVPRPAKAGAARRVRSRVFVMTNEGFTPPDAARNRDEADP